MNTVKYASISSIKIEHEYFANRIDPNLTLVPDGHSKSLMQRDKLRWLWHDNRLDVTALNHDLLRDEQTLLHFALYSNSLEFENYSEIPSVKSGKNLHFQYKSKDELCYFHELKAKQIENLELEGNLDKRKPIAIIELKYSKKTARKKPENAQVARIVISPKSFYWSYLFVHKNISKEYAKNLTIGLEESALMNEDAEVVFDLDGADSFDFGDLPTSVFHSSLPVVTTELGIPGIELRNMDQVVVSSMSCPGVGDLVKEGGRYFLQKVVYI